MGKKSRIDDKDIRSMLETVDSVWEHVPFKSEAAGKLEAMETLLRAARDKHKAKNADSKAGKKRKP